MTGEAKKTTDHEAIRRWAEERGGAPASVEATQAAEDPGILRIDFDDGEPDEGLERIGWDDFFRKFEDSRLAFLYQDQTRDGSVSRFFKFVHRDG